MHKTHINMNVQSPEDLIQHQCLVFHHSLSYVKSMALKCAVELGIPNAIHRHGGSATLSDIVAGTGLPVSRLPYVQRLMNFLSICGVFTESNPPAAVTDGKKGEAVVYKTPMSRLLIDDGNKLSSLSCLVQFVVNPLLVNTFFDMHTWLKDEQASSTKSFFEMTHGCGRFEMAKSNADDNAMFNNAMVAASQITMEVILREAGCDIFGGLSSLVDVGGGHGAASAAISAAFPHVKCSVLDLPHVVDKAPADGTVQFIAGDMFEFIPKADAVLLKWVLHCWDDQDCVKILRLCREAIVPAREAVGKVIIIDIVMGAGSSQDTLSKETRALTDLYMMHLNGVERDERGWEKVIREAGFCDYKIVLVTALYSVIEAYP
ncbi:hypothetical protein PR202_ga28231 [Eleusine coracana subsp. coracana]|uniref:Uncharacterized protein n=1 Tax=Eleusine coracana subsp. coracana TaxID=191504 RepID=A0AAV5DIN7_ELECO|nr:hypothetical protein PR202_ga28231 [Eleusine coracana subsp. coracana]